MTKQELFKQADYTFQRGNRDLAKKYLTEYLAAFPNDEAAWMLMARILEDKQGKIECYERALKINPGNNEARIWLERIRARVNPTLPKLEPIPAPNRSGLRVGLFAIAAVALFATASVVIARNNPGSAMAQALALSTPEVLAANLPADVAPQTRAQVSESYPQYAQLIDVLIGIAVENAESGMEGAPERPGAEIMVSEQAGAEAKTMFEKSLFQPGALNSISVTEQQVTSWLAFSMSNNPDLPLSNVQVYLRNGKVQVWGMVDGTEQSTSALITGTVTVDGGNQPVFTIESVQVGQQVVPAFILAQVEDWINQSIRDAINEYAPGLELMNINVTSGMITISGMR